MALKSTTGICDEEEAAIFSFLGRRGLGTMKDARLTGFVDWTFHIDYVDFILMVDIRVQTDKTLIYASSTFSYQTNLRSGVPFSFPPRKKGTPDRRPTVNFLTNEILWTFLSRQSKTSKPIDNFRVILNKIHLSLLTASLRRLFPSFIPDIWQFWGLVIEEKLTPIFYAALFLLMTNSSKPCQSLLRNDSPALRFGNVLSPI